MSDSPPGDERRLYGDLSWMWPIISPPEHYVDEAEAAQTIIREHSKIPPKTLLHLGCGGGHLDLTLQEHFEVTGVDVSESMLILARRLNPGITYIRGDMRAIRLDRMFDAVTIFDSIDYMLTTADLKAAFATAFAHLRPGGVFLTYAEETAERFQQNRTRSTIRSRSDVDITFVENAYDPGRTDTTFENAFVCMIRRGGGLEIETDQHLSGLFPFQTWLDLLREVGFQATTVEPEGPRSEEEDYPWFVSVKPL